jgi:hypothetical protein
MKKAVVHGFLMIMAFTQCGCGGESGHATASASPAAAPVSAVTTTSVKPLIQAPKAADWCREHGVPESACTRCNASLVAEFQNKGDWCKAHSLPESQCIKCNPALEAKFKAMAPKDGAAQ